MASTRSKDHVQKFFVITRFLYSLLFLDKDELTSSDFRMFKVYLRSFFDVRLTVPNDSDAAEMEDFEHRRRHNIHIHDDT